MFYSITYIIIIYTLLKETVQPSESSFGLSSGRGVTVQLLILHSDPKIHTHTLHLYMCDGKFRHAFYSSSYSIRKAYSIVYGLLWAVHKHTHLF